MNVKVEKHECLAKKKHEKMLKNTKKHEFSAKKSKNLIQYVLIVTMLGIAVKNAKKIIGIFIKMNVKVEKYYHD